MFDTTNVPVMMRRLVLKLEPLAEDEGGGEKAVARWCEATFRVPVLDYALASTIRLPIVGHCYGRDKQPLWGVRDVSFTPPEDQYTVTLALSQPLPDYEPPAWNLDLVKLQRVRVWRVNDDRRDLSLEFVTRHRLPSDAAATDIATLLVCWEMGTVAITLTPVQMALALGDDGTPEPDPEPAPVPGTERRRSSNRAAH